MLDELAQSIVGKVRRGLPAEPLVAPSADCLGKRAAIARTSTLLDPSAASRKRFHGAGRTEETMGDKSPKAKQRDQKQKDAAKAAGTAQARSKQDSYRQTPPIPGKGKR